MLSFRKLGQHLRIGHTTRAEAGYVPLPIDVLLPDELMLSEAFGLQGRRYGTMLAMCDAGNLQPGKDVHQTVGLGGISGLLEIDGYLRCHQSGGDRHFPKLLEHAAT